MDTPPPIDTMTFDQITAFMSSIEGHTAVKYGGALTQRLYEIALDNHVSEAHREIASKLLVLIKQMMELAYSHSPEAVRTDHRLRGAALVQFLQQFAFTFEAGIGRHQATRDLASWDRHQALSLVYPHNSSKLEMVGLAPAAPA
jgi:hypothetical protein